MRAPKYNKSILNLYNDEEQVLAHGFVPLANTIHLYKDELGLTWKEIGLITSVLSSIFQNKSVIHDKDLSPDGKSENENRSFKRQRNSLKEKCYLETAIIKDYNNGFRTLGIKYDFSSLWIKIKELVQRDKKTDDENIEKPQEEDNSNKSSSTDDGQSVPLKDTELQKSNIFLEEYNKLHKEIVGTDVNLHHQKKYILKHYHSRNRELSEIDINQIKQAYKERLSKDESLNKSLAFQDIVGGLLLWASVNDQSSSNQLETKKNKTTRKVKTLDEYNLDHKSSTDFIGDKEKNPSGFTHVCVPVGGVKE